MGFLHSGAEVPESCPRKHVRTFRCAWNSGLVDERRGLLHTLDPLKGLGAFPEISMLKWPEIECVPGESLANPPCWAVAAPTIAQTPVSSQGRICSEVVGGGNRGQAEAATQIGIVNSRSFRSVDYHGETRLHCQFV